MHPISRPLFDLSFQTPHSGICRGPCVGGQFQCPAQLESRFVRRCDRGIRSAGLQVQTARTDGPSAWLSIHPSWSTSHGHDFCGWRLTSRQPSAVQLKCSIALAAMEVSVYQCISHLRAARGQFSEASAALFPTHCAFQQSAHRPSVWHNRQLGQSGAFLASSK